MATAIIFALMLAVTVPLIGTCFQLIRGLFNGVVQITGFTLVADLIEVLDACLPWSIIQFFAILAVALGGILSFLVARKAASIFISLFGKVA